MTGSDYNNIIIDSKESIKMSEKLVLIDGHSILNRAYHGLPDLTNSEGLHTNAVYGFLNIMFKILDEEKPDYLTVAFDVHAPTFRHRMFDAYKGTRKPMDEELRQQVPMIKEMLTAMGIKIVEKEAMRPTIYLEPYLSGQKRPVWMSPSFPETETFCSLRLTMSW